MCCHSQPLTADVKFMLMEEEITVVSSPNVNRDLYD